MWSFSRAFWAIILIFAGISLLFDLNLWHIFWPLLLIFIGIKILLGKPSHNNWASSEESHEGIIDYTAVFSGLNRSVITSDFKGGKINTVFGGGTVDLSRSQIARKGLARLEINAVFGGVKIIVPSTWSVSSSVASVFGAMDNRAVSPKGREEGKLIIKGAAVFGGGEIVNG